MTSAFGSAANPLTINVWSDIMCPFCYLGDTVLEQALAQFPHREHVQIRYHSYQLMPELGTEPVDLNELLAKRYAPEQLAAQHQHLAERGAELGLAYNFDQAITVNTRTAHRLSHFAAESGLDHQLMQELFRAYFSDGKNIADPNTLADLAENVGLDRAEALAVVNSDAFDDAVSVDIAQAAQIGISGVPFFVFDSKYAVSGAQPKEAFLNALNKAWNER